MQHCADIIVVGIAGFLDLASLGRLGRASPALRHQLGLPAAQAAWLGAARGRGARIAPFLAAEEPFATLVRIIGSCPELRNAEHGRAQVFAVVRACLRGNLTAAHWLANAFCLVAGDPRTQEQYELTAGELESFGLPNVNGQFFAIAFGPDAESPPAVPALDLICRRGDVCVAQWIAERFGLESTDAGAWGTDAMSDACARGDLSMAQWLASRFGEDQGFMDIMGCDTLEQACGNKHFNLVEWLAQEFKLGAEDLEKSGALRAACSGGCREDVDRLVRIFGLSEAQLLEEGIGELGDCCSGGYLAGAQRVVAILELDERLVRNHDPRTPNHLLVRACGGGQLAVADWLVDIFGITADDACADHNAALREACGSGVLDMVEWLKVTFDITSDHVQDGGAAILRETLQRGRLGVAEWLAVEFGIACLGAPGEHIGTLAGLCARSPFPDLHRGVYWLVARVGPFDAPGVDRAEINRALLENCDKGLVHLQWFVNILGVTTADIRAGDYAVLRRARGYEKAQVHWLVDHFRLSAGELGAAGIRPPPRPAR